LRFTWADLWTERCVRHKDEETSGSSSLFRRELLADHGSRRSPAVEEHLFAIER